METNTPSSHNNTPSGHNNTPSGYNNTPSGYGNTIVHTTRNSSYNIAGLYEDTRQAIEMIDGYWLEFPKKTINEQLSIYQTVEKLFAQVEENLKKMEGYTHVKLNFGNADLKSLKNLSDILNKQLKITDGLSLELSDITQMIDELNVIKNQLDNKVGGGFKTTSIQGMFNQ